MPRRAREMTALEVTAAKPGPDGKPKRYAAGKNLYLLVRRAALRPGETVPEGKEHPTVKFWIFRYSPPGKLTKAGIELKGSRKGEFSTGGRKGHREMGLGPASGPDALKVADALDKATDLRRMLRDGVDPLEARDAKEAARQAAEKAAKAEAERRARTFANAVEAFLADKIDGRRGNAKHLAQWHMTLTKYAVPKLGDVPVSEVSEEHVLAALRPIWKTKTETASRLRQRIEAVLNYAAVKKWRTGPNPARWAGNLSEVLPKPSEVADAEHHPAVPWQDMPAFMEKLRTQAGVSARALEFAILCASRSGEVRLATWKEVDLDAALWVVPAARMKGKKKRDHRVPLSAAAVAVLRAMLPEDGKPEPDALIFPGAKKGAPLSDMSLGAVMKRMGHGDKTPHGTARSSFRDWGGEATAHPREVLEMALAHNLGDKTEAAYARGDLFEKRRALMADWAAYCTKEPAAVHRLHADATAAEARA